MASPRPGLVGGQEVCEYEDGGPAPAQNLETSWAGWRWIVLPRHGRRPLAVLGRSLLHADNRCAGLPWWSAVTIHETNRGRLAVSIRHSGPNSLGPHSPESGDQDRAWRDSSLHQNAEALREALDRHDPLQALPGVAADMVAAMRFHGAWAGLLAALSGRHAPKARQDLGRLGSA